MKPVHTYRHASGLVTQELTGPDIRTHESHTLPLPVCCPVSKNPRPGSTITISYLPDAWVLEVYSLARLIKQFEGGWRGTDQYPAERNMEGMIRLIARMCSDALIRRVKVTADLVLDAGRMHIRAEAGRPDPREPRPGRDL